MVKWLKIWNNLSVQGKSSSSRNGKLTNQTQLSLTHTCNALVKLCRYLLIDLKFEYALLAKFQTDKLERRFGRYRLMSGDNYHISVVQVLESERKLKMISLLKLTSAFKGTFQLNNLLPDFNHETFTNKNNVIEIDEVFLDALILTTDKRIRENDCKVLIYIGGYIGRVLNKKLNCENCRNFT